MAAMTIRTNNRERPILCAYELTPAELKEFDYLPTDSDGDPEGSFFRYKGNVYDLGEFMRIERAVAPHRQREGWERFDGYATDSYFSGVLVRYSSDFEAVIVARYSC